MEVVGAQADTAGLLKSCRFADHLTALLNHSLSLASGRGETSLDLFIRGKDLSPVDSVFIHEDGSSIDSAAMSSPGSLTDAFAEQHLSPETALSGSPTALNHFQQFRVKRRSSVPALDGTRRARLVKMIGQWEFNALSLDAEELHEASVLVFECIMRMEGVHAGISLGPWAF